MAESNYTELDVSSHSDSDDFSNLESKDDTESMPESSSHASSSSSLLSRLRSPTPSDLSRKRKVAQNLPPVGKKKGRVLLFRIPRVLHLLNESRHIPVNSSL